MQSSLSTISMQSGLEGSEAYYEYIEIGSQQPDSEIYKTLCEKVIGLDFVRKIGISCHISYQQYCGLHQSLNKANRKQIDLLGEDEFSQLIPVTERVRKFQLEIWKGPLGTIIHNFPYMKKLEWKMLPPPDRPVRSCPPCTIL